MSIKPVYRSSLSWSNTLSLYSFNTRSKENKSMTIFTLLMLLILFSLFFYTLLQNSALN